MTRTDPGLLQRIEQLEARVTQLERQARRRGAPTAADRRLLVVLAAAFAGGVVFSATEAARDPLVRGLGLSAAALGRRLQRLALAGHAERIGRSSQGCVWAIASDDQ